MAAPPRSARTRYLIVFLLACASVAVWAPDLRRDFGHPLGDSGVGIKYDGTVIDVSPQAAAAGVKKGDRIDLQGKSPAQRYKDMYPQSPDAGEVVILPLRSRSGPITARIITLPERPNVPVIVLRQVAGLLMLFLGAFLVLKRPNPATWAFFIFSLAGGAPINDFNIMGPSWLQPLANMFSYLFTWGPPFFGAIFALHLLHDGPLPAWRRRIELLIYAAMAVTVACGIATIVLYVYFGINWSQGTFTVYALDTLAYLAIPAILFATYAESDVATRERLRWVIWAFSIAAVANVADALGSQGNLGLYVTTYFEHSLLILAYTLLVAVAVTYTILKHRIIDINVAISRAVVYAALSTIIVGIFALVDLFFTSALSAGRIGLLADVGLALILGFSFNALHARVDRFMDWLFFRARHHAELHIATVASAIPYARSEDHVNRLLVDEPVRAFGFAEGILARVEPEGKLRFIHSAGHHDKRVPTDDAESLIAFLKAERKPLRLSEQHMAVAVPIFSDAELEAVAFYAPHSNGTDIDSDELGLIERAALAAGAAYARFKAQALAKRVAELESENAELRAVSA